MTCNETDRYKLIGQSRFSWQIENGSLANARPKYGHFTRLVWTFHKILEMMA